jgi:hypothetical protein
MSASLEAMDQGPALWIRWQAGEGISDPPWLRLAAGRWTVGSGWACDILVPGCAEPELAALVLDADGAAIEALCDGVSVNGDPAPLGKRAPLTVQTVLRGGGVALVIRAETRGPGGGTPSAVGQGARAWPAAWLARVTGAPAWTVLAGVAGVSALLAVGAGSVPRQSSAALPPAAMPEAPHAAASGMSDPDGVSHELAAGLTRIGSPFHASAQDGQVVVEGSGSAREMMLARSLVGDVQAATHVPIALTGTDPAEIRLSIAFLIAGRVAVLRSGEHLRAGDKLEKGWTVEQIGSEGIRLRRGGSQQVIPVEARPHDVGPDANRTHSPNTDGGQRRDLFVSQRD